MRPERLGPSAYVAGLKSLCRYCGELPPKTSSVHYCEKCEAMVVGTRRQR